MAPSRSRFLSLCLPLLLAGCGLLVLLPGLARAAPSVIFVVSNINDGGAGSLRQAILDANATAGADLIQIRAAGTVHLLSALPPVTEAVTLAGPGAGQFVVDGGDSVRVLDITAGGVTISGLTIQRGSVTGAGADGAGIRSAGSLTLTHVALLSNTAQSRGGGLYATGALVVIDSLFQDNHSAGGTGGALRSNAGANISGTAFLNNSSWGDGGALFALGATWITNTLFQANQCLAGSCDGGALFGFPQTALANAEFIANTAQDQGGGAALPGSPVVTNSLFRENRAVFGIGGGLMTQGAATIQGTTFLSNTARSDGGALSASGALTVTGSVFESNQSTLATGGALYASGPLAVRDSLFLRNAALEGGALSHAFLDDGRVSNSLFAGNEAANGEGAALRLASPGVVEVVHVTIGAEGGGAASAIAVLGGTASITNTIVASHTVGVSNSGGVLRQDYNLFSGNGSDVQGSYSGGSHNAGGDPRFLDPALDDYRLSPGSAAVDRGANASIVADFEGDARPLDGGFDIGYDEFSLIAGLSISYTPAHPLAGTPATFTASITHGTGVSYRWEFGDGAPAFSGNPAAHSYAAPGLYPVTVTATNSADSVSASVTITVYAEPPLWQIRLPLLRR